MFRRKRSAVGESLAGFVETCGAVFEDPLAGYGFAPEFERQYDTSAHPTGASCRFRHPDGRYIRVSATTDFRDGAWVSVHLGEGSAEWPDTDWNAIGLNAFGGRPRGTWDIASIDELTEVLERARTELDERAADFLTGDLTRFRKARARQNRRRKPYQIWSPDERGRYSAVDDDESARLKERYSRDEP